ncbi:MAG: hypothetical protein JW908_17130 [Anaerolineales bacterium]|nr:hypothetical protein [Anaerolineales bacterium]
MKTNRLTTEHLLFALALLLGLGLRLLNLGQAPLSDSESAWALQALSVAQGGNLSIGSQPGYVFLTGALFWLFNDSNTIARLLPALAGSVLILTPLFFRPYLGRGAAVILAFGLALDPGLAAISRQAGSPIVAASCAVIAAGFIFQRRARPGGFFAGLALLCGVALWMGLLGVGLTLIILRWRKSLPNLDDIAEKKNDPAPFDWRASLKQGAITLAITLFLVGSLFFSCPQGLGAWLLSIPDFLKGWVTPSGMPALRLAAGLAVYQPIALIFGLVCIVHFLIKNHISKPLVKSLILWFALSFLISFSYAGRSMGDLVWSLLPLWTLASLELAYLFTPGENPWISIGQAALTFVLLCIAWLIFASMARAGDIFLDWRLLAQLIGALSLLVFAAYLISLGWTWQETRPGLAWGSVAFLSLYMLSAAWGATQYSAGGKELYRQDLWYPAPLTGDADLLVSTLEDLSLWNTNHHETIDIRLAVDAPSMRWVLRDFQNIEIASTQTPVSDLVNLPPDELPLIIITYPLDSDLNLSAAYRGQDFAWQIYPDWDTSLPPSWLSWLVFRNAPQESYQVILWARADIFPGGLLESEMTDSAEP